MKFIDYVTLAIRDR